MEISVSEDHVHGILSCDPADESYWLESNHSSCIQPATSYGHSPDSYSFFAYSKTLHIRMHGIKCRNILNANIIKAERTVLIQSLLSILIRKCLNNRYSTDSQLTSALWIQKKLYSNKLDKTTRRNGC